MDSYVVRIYRRNSSVPESIIGTIELVEKQEVMSFRTVRELMEILSPALGNSREERQGEGPRNG